LHLVIGFFCIQHDSSNLRNIIIVRYFITAIVKVCILIYAVFAGHILRIYVASVS